MTTFPGSYAVPGAIQAGASRPGEPLTSTAPNTFAGSETTIFTQYLDADGPGTTLVAAPGGSYLIEKANGYGPGFASLPALPAEAGLWVVTAR